MESLVYEKEFLKRIKKLREIRKKAHPNEYPIIDDTIKTMEDILTEAKHTQDKPLADSLEDDYIYLKEHSFLWDFARKFAKISCPEYYGDFVFDNILDLTDEEIFAYTHDFYRDATDKKFFEDFLKIYSKRGKTVFITQEKYNEFNADTVFLAYYNDSFIRLNKKGTFDDVSSMIHEYGHAIQLSENYHPNLIDNPFGEIISVAFELLSFEHFSKDNRLDTAAADSQWTDFNSRILLADDVCDEIEIIKQITDKSNGRNTHEKITKYAKQDARTIQDFIEFKTATSIDYVMAELLGIEIYMLYRKDPEKAMYLIHKLIAINPKLESKEYYKKIEELGLHPYRKTGEYQSHLLKRMRTMQKKEDKKNA